MNIYLMRHTQPVSSGPGIPDAVRYLTEHGREHAQRVGAQLADRGISFDFVLCSPLTRAVQTAELTAAACRYTGVVVANGSIASGDGIRELAGELSGMGNSVLVVGHAPLLSVLGGALVNGPFPDFSKGQVCAIEHGALAWTLE